MLPIIRSVYSSIFCFTNNNISIIFIIGFLITASIRYHCRKASLRSSLLGSEFQPNGNCSGTLCKLCVKGKSCSIS